MEYTRAILERIHGCISAQCSRLRERGATAVEYGMIIALIAAIMVFAVIAVGDATEQGFENFNTEFDAQVAAGNN